MLTCVPPRLPADASETTRALDPSSVKSSSSSSRIEKNDPILLNMLTGEPPFSVANQRVPHRCAPSLSRLALLRANRLTCRLRAYFHLCGPTSWQRPQMRARLYRGRG